MPTKANKGGALLFIYINYKVRHNLQIHKYEKLESILIEVISKSQKNGCWLHL